MPIFYTKILFYFFSISLKKKNPALYEKCVSHILYVGTNVYSLYSGGFDVVTSFCLLVRPTWLCFTHVACTYAVNAEVCVGQCLAAVCACMGVCFTPMKPLKFGAQKQPNERKAEG